MRYPPSPPATVAGPLFGGEGLHAASEGLYDFVRRAQLRYLPWDKVRFKAPAEEINPAVAWSFIAFDRETKLQPLPLTGKGGASLRFWLTDTSQRELMLIDQQLAGRIGRSTGEALKHGPKESYIINSLMEEAIASSMIEGAVTTHREAKAMLRNNRRPRSRGERMVANNYNAIRFIRDHLRTPLSEAFLLELQSILAEDTMREEWIGRLRTANDDVTVMDERDGEVMHQPPPAEDLSSRLQALYQFANTSIHEGKEFVHPVVRAIALHFQLAYEHPFCDGNGRTARALFYWFMLRQDYWLFEYLPISRLIYRAPVQYNRAFLYTETDNFDLGYFLHYHLGIISKARAELAHYLAAQQDRHVKAAQTFAADLRLNPRQKLLLQNLRAGSDHVTSIQHHRSRQQIAYATARKDLQQLEEYGYLTSRKIGNKLIFSLNSSG